MIRIRYLLAQRLMNPAVAVLLLLVVAFRLLLPPGLMFSPSTSTTGGDFAICSGHGALSDGTAAISTNTAAKAAAENIAHALASSAPQTDHQHTGDTCPFSAALTIGVAAALFILGHWLRADSRPLTARLANDALPTAMPRHGSLGARAPPLATPA